MENKMKVYIITYRVCDMEGRPDGFPKIYKVFTNKERAEEAKKEAENKYGWRRCGWTVEEGQVEE